MEIDLRKFKNKWDFLKDKTIYIACSGGLDSIVLTHLAQKLSKKCILLHVNYNLRGEESKQDEIFVREFAQRHKIECKVNSIYTENILKKSKKNIQLFARDFRYEWFSTFLNDENSFLFLGHHLDDQIETFYLNLARKSGILGLACMPEKKGQLIRPLLEFEKGELKRFALENKFDWREDSSNSSLKYTRNKIRNEFLPFLYSQIPDLKDSIIHLVKVFQKELISLENSISGIYTKILKDKKLEFNEYLKLSLDQQVILLKKFDFKASQLSEIEKLIVSSKGKSVSSKRYKIIHEGSSFSVVSLSEIRPIPKIIIDSCNEMPKQFSKDIVYFDASKIKGDLKIRTWKKGDKIDSIGIVGSQLISDIIKDAKIKQSEKSSVVVVHDEENILWCCGLKISRHALANETCLNVLKISIDTNLTH